MKTCSVCGRVMIRFPWEKGHREREYCSDACRQKAYRKRRTLAPSAEYDRQKHIETLERLYERSQETIEWQDEKIRELEEEVNRLQSLQDVERRYYLDTEERPFKAWLKIRAHVDTPGHRMLLDTNLPPRGSRARYEAILRKLRYSPEDIKQFQGLWKAMLLSS